jgi:hypothetical protein
MFDGGVEEGGVTALFGGEVAGCKSFREKKIFDRRSGICVKDRLSDLTQIAAARGEIFASSSSWPNRRKVQSQSSHMLILVDKALRTRNGRRQATPPLIIPTDTPEQKQSGVSLVNKEIASLIARKDPVLNRVGKKSKTRISKQKKERVEAKMIKAAAKAVIYSLPGWVLIWRIN